MASVYFRGAKASPRWFARYKSAAGAWRSTRVRVETRSQALRIARHLEGQAEMRRHGLLAPEGAALLVGSLLDRWCDQLTNRSAYDDRSRTRLHVRPRFASMRLGDLTLAVLMAWLDDLRAGGLAAGTQRHLLTIVGRFMGWCVERGLAQSNPVRQIPSGKRPRPTPAREVPWLDDDATVRSIMAALPVPLGLAFFVANRAGLRLGEVCGLRLSDVADLSAGAIRVRYSYNGPLKEDRRGGKVKWAPMPSDAAEVLGPWVAARRAESDDPEALLFPGERGRCLRKEQVGYRWQLACRALGLSLSWYQATRHSFASRNLSRGVPLDQVAAALGHSTPAVTAAHYAHFIRKTFDPRMTAGMGAASGGGAVGPEEGGSVLGAPVSRHAEPGAFGGPRNQGRIPTAQDQEGVGHGL